MASSRSSSSSCQPKHDVFLSFSGEDTRKTFTSYLYRDLKRKGIGAFMDENDLKKGDELSPALLKAIKESKISLIIFSKNYASSLWCLQELFKIMELKRNNKQVVLPIFYHVNPSDVRNCTGSFEKAFADHLEKWEDKLQGWKEAFAQAGNMKGWHIPGGSSDRAEPEYMEEIIGDVIKKLNCMSPSDSNELVGIGHQMEQIRLLLCIGAEGIRIIGIWGLGGIGKTTLAQAIYDEVSAQFESCCFLANVREESKKHDGITSLRDKLLSKILEEENLCIDTPRIGSKSIKDRLRRKRVLVILDDVSDFKQLESLAVSRDTFGSGSRIIITSRDKKVFRNGADGIYEVQELNDDDSLQLFSLYAFKQKHPIKDFRDLSDKVLEYAKGIPIALMILGSALYYQNSREYWESALNKLKEDPNREILNILKISFEGLDDTERNIFLDIACFFKESNRENVTKLLDSCYGGSAHCGISNLIDKCLLIGHDTLSMHDLLQELAWSIVRQESKEPGERSRLWDPKDVCRVFNNDRGTKLVEGIFLDLSQVDEIQLHPDVFARMHNLRFIKFYYPLDFLREHKEPLLLNQGLNSLHGDQLRYFHWEYGPLKSLPSNFSPEKLIELILPNSNIKQLWNGNQNLVNLRVINLQGCKNLIRIPSLSKAMNIEEFLVRGCRSLVKLPCMSHFKSLKGDLDLSNCGKLKRFPEIPQHLKSINLSGTAIKNVPSSSIECLSELTSLDMSGTGIKNLPTSIVKLNGLELVNLSHCPKLTNFPNLPKSIKHLYLSDTPIKEVPSSIECLENLTVLSMRECKRLKSLPPSICKLKSLLSLDLNGCSKLQNPLSMLDTTMRISSRCFGLKETVITIEPLPQWQREFRFFGLSQRRGGSKNFNFQGSTLYRIFVLFLLSFFVFIFFLSFLLFVTFVFWTLSICISRFGGSSLRFVHQSGNNQMLLMSNFGGRKIGLQTQ